MDIRADRPVLRGWIHLVASIGALVAMPFLVVRGNGAGSRAALIIYAVAITVLFVASAAYHRVIWTVPARRVMRRIDHVTIFLAIAGTYTAVASLVLVGWARLTILLIVWSGAALGIVISQAWLDAPKVVAAVPYVIVGWSALVVLPQLYRGIGGAGFVLLISGGLAYTEGAIVYAVRRPDPRPGFFGYHEVFHALTVCGAVLQYIAIAAYAIPRA